MLLPGSAVATSVPGANGDIAFTSGRAPQNNDSNARIWVFRYPNGPATQVTTVPDNTQHRQPNWSPDHTKIAYAAAGAGGTSIWIKNLVTGTASEFIPAANPQDKPSWSPDGTKIAYGQVGKIFVKAVAPGSTAVPLTLGSGDERPVWSPDGSTIYFNRLVAANDNDIYKVPASGGTATPLVTGGTNDWQPAVSPNGSTICFTRGPKSDGADLWTAGTSALNTNVAVFSANATLGDLNCAWSPDGTKIAYTEGAFSKGQLVEKKADGSGFRLLSADAVPSVYFDGNADWATNFPPHCRGGSFRVPPNTAVRIPLSCSDPERDRVARTIVSKPRHGTLGQVGGRVKYTPSRNFVGSDSFKFRGSDGRRSSNVATVKLAVARDTTAPVVDRVRVKPRRWRRGKGLPAALARAAVGTTISYRLSEPARATLTFGRRVAGRKVGRRCRRTTRRNRSHRRCARYVTAGRLKVGDARQGTNRLRFRGRLSRRKRLRVGRYRLTIRAADLAGNRSKRSKPARFRIVRR